jgi:hypothetical protein
MIARSRCRTSFNSKGTDEASEQHHCRSDEIIAIISICGVQGNYIRAPEPAMASFRQR